MPGAAPTMGIQRDAFVAVMLRRRIVDLDYDAFLKAHPEQMFFP